MRFIQGFDEEILEALKCADPEIVESNKASRVF
jgi:hypothetical protein